jgi:large subunit GTPase 1
MPSKAHKSNSSLGKSLMKNKNAPRRHQKDEDGFRKHTVDLIRNDGPSATGLKSVLEQNSLEEFMQMADMSKRKFEAERGGAQLVEANTVIPVFHEDSNFSQSNGVISKFLTEANINRPFYKPLKIPRRPEWTKEMSATEINQNESFAFLNWRRDIASIEENNVKLAITPFEKNIEVWKQLWRVIEKSDLLLQIVDARNPFFYYSEDLEKYI